MRATSARGGAAQNDEEARRQGRQGVSPGGGQIVTAPMTVNESSTR